MKRIVKALIIVAIAVTIPFIITSCKDEWEDDNSSNTQSEKFDYIYSCIGKSGLSVIAQIENDGYKLADVYDDGDAGKLYKYVKNDYYNGVDYQYYLYVQNNVVKAMTHAEIWDDEKVDSKKIKDGYTQMLCCAYTCMRPVLEFTGMVKITPYGSTPGDWDIYWSASSFINLIENYNITNNCMGGESIEANSTMKSSAHYSNGSLFLDDYTFVLLFDISDREWYDEYINDYESNPTTFLYKHFNTSTIPNNCMTDNYDSIFQQKK